MKKIMIAVLVSSMLLLCACSNSQTVAENAETTSPSKAETTKAAIITSPTLIAVEEIQQETDHDITTYTAKDYIDELNICLESDGIEALNDVPSDSEEATVEGVVEVSDTYFIGNSVALVVTTLKEDPSIKNIYCAGYIDEADQDSLDRFVACLFYSVIILEPNQADQIVEKLDFSDIYDGKISLATGENWRFTYAMNDREVMLFISRL